MGMYLRRRWRGRLGVVRGPEIPLPAELLEAKFLNCAARVLPMEQAESLLGALRELDALSDMRRVTDAMRPSAALAAD